VCSTVSGLEKLIVVQWSVMGGIHASRSDG